MPRGYSRDLRERLLQAVTSGVPLVEIERTTGVSSRSLQRWRRKADAGMALGPGTSPGRPPAVTLDEDEALRAQVTASPDATLAEHCAQWAAAGYASVSVPTMCRTLARLGMTRKKRH
ncbi:MAG TPA: transposase [Chloroflexota bacterium]|nr:transposase [Chloroflexota bacterium]